MRSHKVLSCLLVSAMIIFGAAVGHAQVSGTIWQGDTSSNADSPILTGPSANFTATGIDFDSRVTGYTPFLFLNSPTFTGASATFAPNGSLDNSHILLTGTIYLSAGANAFDVAHDDGLNITLNGGIGTVLDVPGPTSPVLTPFTITATTAGLYTYTLNYNECCGPPAVLVWEYPTGAPVGSVPEPCTMLLMGTGLVGLAAYRKFKKI